MRLFAAVATLTFAFIASATVGQEYLPGLRWPEPAVVTPGDQPGAAPSDATVLFDGTNLSAFRNAEHWQIKEGALVVGRGDIYSKAEFGDCQLHIEWSAPTKIKGKGQGRGNSGVFFMALGDPTGKTGYNGYEVQILDSYQNATYFDGQAGAIYKQQPPMVNAMRPPGEWNVYDIFFTAPRFAESGELLAPAYLTVMHNGVLLQNHCALQGETCWRGPARYLAHAARGPLRLQDHGNPVRYRNIWVREFKPLESEREHQPRIRRGNKVVPYQPNSKS